MWLCLGITIRSFDAHSLLEEAGSVVLCQGQRHLTRSFTVIPRGRPTRPPWLVRVGTIPVVDPVSFIDSSILMPSCLHAFMPSRLHAFTPSCLHAFMPSYIHGCPSDPLVTEPLLPTPPPRLSAVIRRSCAARRAVKRVGGMCRAV